MGHGLLFGTDLQSTGIFCIMLVKWRKATFAGRMLDDLVFGILNTFCWVCVFFAAIFSLILFLKLLEAHPHAQWSPLNFHSPSLVWLARSLSDQSSGIRCKCGMSELHSCSPRQGSLLPKKKKPIVLKSPNA